MYLSKYKIKLYSVVIILIVSGIFFLSASIRLEGEKQFFGFLLFFFHMMLAFFILNKKNWARIITLIYVVFQIGASITSLIVAILSLQINSFTSWIIFQIILSIFLLPILAWICFFLMKNETDEFFKS